MSNVKGRGKPVGFKMIPEGNQVVHVTDVKGIPRENVTVITMKMVNSDGLGWDKFPQKYDLTSEGGYYLLLNGYGINLEDGDSFNIDALEDTYVEVEVVHKDVPAKDGNGTKTFANIRATVGPGEAFGAEAPAESGENWDEE
jgi:hypothetical protein